jgi:hypothetical protein
LQGTGGVEVRRTALLTQGNDILNESSLQYAISHRQSPICGHPFALFLIDPPTFAAIYKDVAKGCLQIGDWRWLIADLIHQVCDRPDSGGQFA